MKKTILVFLILPLLLLGACSEKEWSYKYEGATDNWNGVTDEEVKSFFGDYPVFKIDWTDEEGIDHTETIYLKYAAQ
ncbi:hypothetical protein [Brevibacillus brevis]|uniref:hypothetical protein n=1 Tax=Brevibacillus brevis TaxID=1393 RepID=UPI001158A0FE|nr:hypothetical protein [Lysinibacillus sp. SDF0063]TQR35056.1 hypothetical protein C7Y45_17710 [Lysinibacillus sp. SDF0063]